MAKKQPTFPKEELSILRAVHKRSGDISENSAIKKFTLASSVSFRNADFSSIKSVTTNIKKELFASLIETLIDNGYLEATMSQKGNTEEGQIYALTEKGKETIQEIGETHEKPERVKAKDEYKLLNAIPSLNGAVSLQHIAAHLEMAQDRTGKILRELQDRKLITRKGNKNKPGEYELTGRGIAASQKTEKAYIDDILSEQKKEAVYKAVIEINGASTSIPIISQKSKVPVDTVGRILKQLENEGLITKEKTGEKSTPHRYERVDQDKKQPAKPKESKRQNLREKLNAHANSLPTSAGSNGLPKGAKPAPVFAPSFN